MSAREIPGLILTCLRCISKKPNTHLTEGAVARAFTHCSQETRQHVTELLVASVTDAGRFVDDGIPVALFDKRSTAIDIQNAKVSAAYLKRLVNQSPELEELNVAGCFQVDDDIVTYVLQKCRKLKKLNIQNCRKLTDRSLEDISQSGLELTALDIGGNMNMTEQGIIQFLQNYPSALTLTELNLSGLPVTEIVLTTLTNRYRSIESLGIAYALIHEENVRFLLSQMGKILKKLNIAWLPCDDSRDTYNFAFFEHLNATCPNLVELDLCGLRTVTAANLQKFLEARVIQVCQCQILIIYFRLLGIGLMLLYMLYTFCLQVETNPGAMSYLKLLRAKFICTPKQQVEQLLLLYAPMKYEV
jgi:hypothetical protein